MGKIPDRLGGFIEGLCAASQVHFPYGGLQLRNYAVNDAIEMRPKSNVSEPMVRLMEYFTCALGDTTRTNPQDAEPAVEAFLKAIRDSFPPASIHIEISERDGWFEDLQVWVNSPGQHAHILLDWSVS